MKIERFESSVYRIPLTTTLSDSTHGHMPDFELILVKLGTDDGAEGIGYSYTIRGGRSIKFLIDDLLREQVLGEDPFHTERLWDKMWWGSHFVGRGGASVPAMAAVDIALWDLKGNATGRSICDLLGGHSDRVKAYAGGVDLYFTTDELLKQAEGYLAQGYKAIKMKVGRDNLREDLERIEAMRRFLGEDVVLMVDANMQWSIDQAIAAGRAMEEFGLYWIEEPIIPDDVEGHAQVAASISIPLAAGENLYTKYDFKRYLEAGAVQFPEPDVVRVGGITEFRKICALAECYNLNVTSHGVDELHVHLLAAIPNSSYLERHSFRLDAYLKEPFLLKDGCVEVPERPGHGIEFDFAKMEKHKIL